jgi:hypothetical protein
MSNGLDSFEKTMKSKAALDALNAVREYDKLIAAGWPKEKAFQVAFMGVHILFDPRIKPLPEPDPPFSLEGLYQVVKEVQSHVSNLQRDVADDLAFLETLLQDETAH